MRTTARRKKCPAIHPKPSRPPKYTVYPTPSMRIADWPSRRFRPLFRFGRSVGAGGALAGWFGGRGWGGALLRLRLNLEIAISNTQDVAKFAVDRKAVFPIRRPRKGKLRYGDPRNSSSTPMLYSQSDPPSRGPNATYPDILRLARRRANGPLPPPIRFLYTSKGRWRPGAPDKLQAEPDGAPN